MEKIKFENGKAPYINDVNLNKLQDNIEIAIDEKSANIPVSDTEPIEKDVELWIDTSEYIEPYPGPTPSASGDTLPIGAIIPYSSDNIPDNWLLADGRAVSRTTYKKLFDVIGTTYGSGDGSTTFNLPNLKGRIPVGQDEDSLEFAPLAMEGGEKTHTLTIEEMPSHKHTANKFIYNSNVRPISIGSGGGVLSEATGAVGVDNTGGSQPHNNLQPYLVTNYIIKAAQSSGLVATVVDNLESESEKDALSSRQGKILYEKILELKEKNIITAYPTSELTDITQSQQKVNLDGYDSIGEKITVENNAIKIGKGISKILISSQIFYQDGPTGNGYYFPNIKINDKIVARSIVPTSVSGGIAFITAYINEFLIDVKEGDLITLSTGESSLGFTNLKYRGIQYGDEIKRRHTYITVEAIA